MNLYVAPKLTEVPLAWGSSGITRGTTSTTNGVANTTTLHSFGSAAHPAAYYCKSLTTGGYNTWYLPARNELLTIYSNRTATPFATANGFGSYNWSSTEENSSRAWYLDFRDGTQANYAKTANGAYVRAARRSTI